MDRFIENWNLVSITLQKRLQQESYSHQSVAPSSLFDGSTEGPTFS